MSKAVDPKKKNVLPSKENQIFKSIVRFYEDKNYKKGLKAADQILKKFPEHGETLAMKGLTLNCMNKKTEAYEYVRKGLKFDLASHVCWHVYGLLYRSDREYNEAIKCYKNALRNDKDNTQILRDLAILQVHLRDIEGYMETRRKLLVLKPQNKQNWIAYAIGAHLSKNNTKALQVIDEYLSTVDNVPRNEEYENSEILLYKNMIIEESGNYQGALDNLAKIEKQVVDKLHIKEKRGELYLKLNKNAEAEKQYRELLEINPDSHDYHYGLMKSLGLNPSQGNTDSVELNTEDTNKLLSLYDQLAKQYPSSDSVYRIPLNYVSGNLFQERLHAYVIKKLRKGVPSLFVDIKSLYSNPSKAIVIGELFEQYEKNLKEKGTFQANSEGEAKKESPQTLFWTQVFLAQHYDIRGEPQLAIKTIDDAIVHTPTVVELYNFKGKILKHAGDLDQASENYDKARELDLADRYLNTKSARHLLRADKIEQAFSTLGLFTKEGEDPVVNLMDMQCMWFEYECGSSHLRKGQIGQALKKLHMIEKHFDDITEDQFDFHTYCLRKMTLRSYIGMIRLEDRLHAHPFFLRGAKALIKTYVNLHDNPVVDEKKKEEEDLEKMSVEDRKKYLKKKNKEERKKQEQELENQKNTKPDPKKKVDPDPEGKTLLHTPDKLAAATKVLQKLLRDAPNDVEVQFLACDVYMRKKKYLLVLKALKKAQSIAPEHPDLHRNKIKFLVEVNKQLATLPASVKQVIELERDLLLGDGKQSNPSYKAEDNSSLIKYNDDYLKLHMLSIPQRAAAAEMMYYLDNSKKTDAINYIKNVDGAKGHKDMKSCVKNYDILLNVFGESKVAEDFKEKCKGLFPYATFFLTEEEKNAKKQAQLKENQTEESANKTETEEKK